MTEVAKIPDHHDMDYGMFAAHWMKRHHYEGYFDKFSEKYPDDDAPIWWAVRNEHDRIHVGVTRIPGEVSTFPIPTDHIHLARVDPEIQRILAELL